VPGVLLSGDHARIARWRRVQAIWLTWRERPDLLATAPLTPDERKLVERFERGETPEQLEDPRELISRTLMAYERTVAMDAIRLVRRRSFKKDGRGFAPGDTVRVHVQGDRGREGAVAGLRGHRHPAARRGRPRLVHGPAHLLRRRGGAHLPAALARIERVEIARRSGCGARSSITCAGSPARPRASRKSALPLVPATVAEP